MLTAILAISDDDVIGVNGGLPWRLSHDLRRFKMLTTGHAVIMGRKTYESIGRPLPNRTNVVVTRDVVGFRNPGGLDVFSSLERALSYARKIDPSPYVIGGEEIYRQLWPLCDRVELTEVHVTIADSAGDRAIRFPFERAEWQEDVSKREGSTGGTDAKGERYPGYTFRTLERV